MSNGFYFNIMEIDGETTVMICEAEFFNKFGYIEDSGAQELYDSVMNPLSDKFEELTDATYGTNLSVGEARIALLDAGFEDNEKFNKFMDSIG